MLARSSSSSVRRIARVASAYEKLGPAVPVPPNSVIQRSQRDGAGQEVLGRTLHQRAPRRHRDGEQPDEAHVVVERQPRHDDLVVGDLRGRPGAVQVVTDRAVREHHALGLGGRARGELQHRERVGIARRTLVVVERRRRRARTARRGVTKGGSPGAGSMKAARSGSMTTTLVSERRIRARVWAMNWSSAPIRMGSGIVTSAAPVSQVAWMVVTSCGWWGRAGRRGRPGRTPRACRPAAHAAGLAWSCVPADVLVSSPAGEGDATPCGSAATDSIRSISDSTLF